MENNLKNILLPFDDSNNSHRALDYAINLAKATNSKITLIHVVSYQGAIAKIIEPYKGKLIDHVSAMMANAQKQIQKSGVKSNQKILYGSIIDELLKASKKRDFDMIIIGRRGVNKFTGSIGSVSNALVHNSKIPITIIP